MKKIYCLFLILLIAVGCYDDKGNYKYEDLQELTIGDFDSGDNVLEVEVGQEIIVKTNITPDITDDLSRYTFKWILSGETRPEWNKKDFIWVADRPTDVSLTFESLILEVTDTRHGTKYMNRENVFISPEFASPRFGYLILSEDDGGNSKLHYMKYTARDSRPDPVNPDDEVEFPTEIKKYLNIFEKQNNNEPLGKGPISIQQHYTTDINGVQYCIFQKSAAVEVEYTGLKKEGVLSTSFSGGNYPNEITHLQTGSFMKWLDVMSDQDGRLFSRHKGDENLYNTGTFLKNPIEFEDEVLEDCTVFRTDYNGPDYGLGGALIFDKKNGRFLLMFDGETEYGEDYKDAGKIVVLPSPEGGVPEDCRAFDDFKNCEILSLNIQYGADWDLVIAYKDETGKLRSQIADLTITYGTSEVINRGMKNHVITNAPANISKVVVTNFYSTSYIFIVDKNKIYLVDTYSGNYNAELYYTTESDITALAPSTNASHSILLGTVDGFFYEVDASGAKNKITSKIEDKHKLLFREGGFEKIIDIINCEFRYH